MVIVERRSSVWDLLEMKREGDFKGRFVVLEVEFEVGTQRPKDEGRNKDIRSIWRIWSENSSNNNGAEFEIVDQK